MIEMEKEAFIKEAYSEIDEMNRKELEANEAIRNLIAQHDEKFSTFNFIGQKIRYRPLIGKRLRHKMAIAKKALNDDDPVAGLEKTERMIYEILGELCLDTPFNTWQAWAYLDEKAEGIGGVQPMFKSLMDDIAKTSEDVKNFR